MEKLTIVRTNPTQGQPVKVEFLVEGTHELAPVEQIGAATFPFPLWLQFEKLVKDGMEARARIETRETRRIEVSFRPPEVVPQTQAPAPAPAVPAQVQQYVGGVSNLAAEEEGEQEQLPAGVQPGAQKRLPKSLGGAE